MTEEQESILDDLLEVESGLSLAAVEFIEDLDENRHWDLTPKQDAWLEALAEQHL